MRQILCCLALSAVLIGSLAPRANAQTAAVAKNGAVLGKLVKECADTIARESPKTKIVGKFFLSKKNKPGIIAKLIDTEEMVALGAPTTRVTPLGKLRGYTGCTYYVRSGTLSFDKVVGHNFFPPRYKLEPGED